MEITKRIAPVLVLGGKPVQKAHLQLRRALGMRFAFSQAHVQLSRKLPACGKRMVLWLRLKELNLVLTTQVNVRTAECFYQTS